MNRAFAAPLGALWLAAAAPALAGPARAAVEVRFGVMAEEPTKPDKLLQVYSGLLSVLRARLEPAGVRVGEMLVTRDVEELGAALRAGRADFVIETLFPTLMLRRRSGGLDPELVVVRRGEREYRSVFFARREDPIDSLRDLRGRVLVLQALRSTSAFALPRAELAAAGIPLVPADQAHADARAVRYALAGGELNQAVWVASGRGDAGAFNEGDWQALPEGVRGRLRVFHRTKPLLRGLLSLRPGLAAPVRAALLRALVELRDSPDGSAALEQAAGITRFERMTGADRAGLRSWEKVFASLPPAP